MIYTLTLNPSLDYVMYIDNFTEGEVNRSKREQILVGGKGINVSVVLSNLKEENTMLGFVSGFTGKEIQDKLSQKGYRTDFIELQDGFSRINVKLNGKIESEINGQGPKIDQDSIEKLYSKLSNLNDGDFLVLAGSIPNSLDKSIYENIIKYLKNKNINIVVDATDELLLNVLKYNPFLVKPNQYELGEMFNVSIDMQEDIIKYGKILQEKGARNVLVSMASEGAIFISEDGNIIENKAPKGEVKNSVGAGDSMVAGFIHGYIKGDMEMALKMAIAAGSASAFSYNLATKEEVYNLYNNIN